jgi:hypothetical protein
MPVYTAQGLEQQSQSFEAFPAGDYNLIVSDITDGPFGNGSGHKVDITFEVVDGEYKGRKLFDLIALVHTNPEWAQGTQARLDALCAVAGFPALEAFSQLLNTMVHAKVFIEKDKTGEYDPKNKIDKILGPAKAGGGAAAPAMGAPAMTPAPTTTTTMSAPAAMTAPAAAPAPVAAAASPPLAAAPARPIAVQSVDYSDGSKWNTAVYTDTGELVPPEAPGYVAPVATPIDEDDIPF